jgi:hypothetical protein
MLDGKSLFFDELRPKLLFRGEQVMGPAAQREISRLVLATSSKRLQMVKLEAARFTTTLTRGVDVRAARGVALKYLAANGGGDISSAPARNLLCLRDLVRLAWSRIGTVFSPFQCRNELTHCS